jgi:5-methylcytosine-specific restriction enzyme A
MCVCDTCRGVRLPAHVVDHIVPHRGDPALFWDESNWQAMAKVCHDRKTATSDGGFGR